MTREFYKDLQESFPLFDESTRRGYRIVPSGYEQFHIVKCYAHPNLPKERIERVAREQLKGLRYKISVATSMNMLQGVNKDNVLISLHPKRPNQLHFIAIAQDEFPSLFISLSWHGSYGLTPFQHMRYLEFIKSYFSNIPHLKQQK